jgi:Ca-activated chloride channel family protein
MPGPSLPHLRPRIARPEVFLCLVALVLAAPPAAAQEPSPEERGEALLILDSSKSMNDPAGNGGTRMDAAKAAVDQLLEALPEGAPVGIRVYGATVAETTRAEGCRDTELVVPVGPLDKDAARARVQALEGKGRTPIGNSLLAAPDDMPDRGRPRTVILVSDGGDNCAPPNPCEAAREVARQGLNLKISVVGLQVTDRVRRQLQCIADAGGGSYVDAADPEQLADELSAAFARAFRAYEPTGTPVEGGPSPEQATPVGTGLFLDELRAGTPRWYSVEVKPGERLFATATAVVPRDGSGVARMDLDIRPEGQDVQAGSGETLVEAPRQSEHGLTTTASARTYAPIGEDEELSPGRYQVGVTLAHDFEGPAIPLEVALETLGPDERPGLLREPGTLPDEETPTPTATPTPAPAADEDGMDVALAAGAGVAGLVAGAAGGFAALRRRRA